jgi:hypothetical protein
MVCKGIFGHCLHWAIPYLAIVDVSCKLVGAPADCGEGMRVNAAHQSCAHARSQNLADGVRQGAQEGDSAGQPEAQGDRRVDVTTCKADCWIRSPALT